MPDIEFSVVIPLFNEEGSLSLLQEELDKVMEKLNPRYEIIYVDDGSTDSSPVILEELEKNFPKIKVISFKKNTGQSAALLAGFKESAGKRIITLDGDLQNPPGEIFKLAPFRQDFDYITGIRRNRKDNFLKKLYSAVARFFRWLVLGDITKDTGCSLRMFRREVIDFTPPLKNFHRFLTFLARKRGFRIKEIHVEHAPRKYGRSKYHILNKIRSGIFDLWCARRLKY